MARGSPGTASREPRMPTPTSVVSLPSGRSSKSIPTSTVSIAIPDVNRNGTSLPAAALEGGARIHGASLAIAGVSESHGASVRTGVAPAAEDRRIGVAQDDLSPAEYTTL